jgi:hypothetical protein
MFYSRWVAEASLIFLRGIQALLKWICYDCDQTAMGLPPVTYQYSAKQSLLIITYVLFKYLVWYEIKE